MMSNCEIIDERHPPNGVCPDCGHNTVDGVFAGGCGYSSISCHTCGHFHCEGACSPLDDLPHLVSKKIARLTNADTLSIQDKVWLQKHREEV